MTTIAFDGKTIAADSRVTANYHISNTKKLYENGDFVFGGAGQLTHSILVWDWISAGMPKKERPDVKKWDGVIWDRKKRKLFYIDDDLVFMPIADKRAAVGSGAEYALAAMHMGASARYAVAVASKFDAQTGGKIVTIKVRG